MINEIDGLYWPKDDSECRRAVLPESSNIELVLPLVEDFSVCVQAGGNVGVYPIRLAERFGAVYTFEPDPLNFLCLSRNALSDNIVKFQAALGDERGLVDLAREPHNCGAHYVANEGIVPTLRIDDLGLKSCGLIWLDIEGYELFALRGGERTISDYRPVIAVEDKGLSEKYGVAAGACGEYLSEFGYSRMFGLGRDVVYKCGQ